MTGVKGHEEVGLSGSLSSSLAHALSDVSFSIL
jgi:hypothetical protein